CLFYFFFFFFSSRRRHTRSKRDWSSDVCSSDLWAIGLRTHTHQLPVASCYWRDCIIHSYQFGFAISYSYAFYSIVPAKNFPCMAQNFGLKILQIVITNLLW